MKKNLTKLLTIGSILLPLTAQAQLGYQVNIEELTSPTNPLADVNCVEQIVNDRNFQKLVDEAFSEYTYIGNTERKAKLEFVSGLFIAAVQQECPEQTDLIFGDNGIVPIYIRHQYNEEYQQDMPVFIQIKLSTMTQFAQYNTAILVTDKCDYKVTDTIYKADMPQEGDELPWSGDCSDHYVAGNLSDDAHINLAGQALLGNEHEYYLDFASGDYTRAFPGLLLEDVTWSTEDKIVTFSNLHNAIKFQRNFTNTLSKSSFCQDSKKLCTYLVSLDNIQKDSSMSTGNDKDGFFWKTTGGTAAVTAALAWNAAAAAGTATGGILSTIAASASAVPVWGWVVAGVIVAGAGIYSLIPQEIRHQEEVVVMAGPLMIKK